jgi:hypothetical protein
MNETIRVCEGCGREVGPDADAVVAVGLVHVQTFGGADTLEGLRVVFHRSCFPTGSPDYRLIEE